MSGAIGSTSLGVGYNSDFNEPKITVVQRVDSNDLFVVCIRRTDTWKEIIAEFREKSHAEFYADALRSRKLRIPAPRLGKPSVGQMELKND